MSVRSGPVPRRRSGGGEGPAEVSEWIDDRNDAEAVAKAMPMSRVAAPNAMCDGAQI